MPYKQICSGPLSENCYILYDENSLEAAIIDPGFVNDELLNAVSTLKVKYILLTHGHFDHIWGAEELKSRFLAPICIYEDDAELAASAELNASRMMLGKAITCEADIKLSDGETLMIGGIEVRVIHTPGHTSGGCCYCTDEAVFTGDTLMSFSVGRCDLPTGDEEQLLQSLKRLKALNGDPVICGGHGSVTVLSAEKQYNPYLRAGTV